jgi:hypothetical protein
MISKIVLMKPNSSGLNLLGFSDLKEAITSAVSGDNICIQAPGTYDLSDSQLIMKDGVNLDGVPGVIIKSSNNDGTISDNGVACICKISENIRIANTGNSAIHPVNKTNSLSNFGYRVTISGIIAQSGSSEPVWDTTYKSENTLGVNPTFSYIDVGSYHMSIYYTYCTSELNIQLTNSVGGRRLFPQSWANYRNLEIDVYSSGAYFICSRDVNGNLADDFQAFIKIVQII